jgi:uncharacterized membrane protein (UPF0127 family)
MDKLDEQGKEALPKDAHEAVPIFAVEEDNTKSFTLRNYPFWYLILIASIAVGGVGTFSLVNNAINPQTTAGNALHVLVGDKDVIATVIRLDVINPENQSLVFGEDALLIVLSKSEKSPQLKLSKQSVDVVWISADFTIVSIEEDVAPEASGVLQAPEDADFALVSRTGFLPRGALEVGNKVYIADKTKLQ